MDQPSKPAWPGDDELRALGRVVQAASSFEEALGNAFCALIGSKYAAVLIGGKTSGALIQDCRSLTKVQKEISQEKKEIIHVALNNCAQANEKRNRLIHDIWAMGSSGSSQQLRRAKSGYDLEPRAVSLNEIRAAITELTNSAVKLHETILNAFGPERSTLEAQLRWQDAVAAMPSEELTDLMFSRLAGMLGELSRLLSRYGEEAMASWANKSAETVKASRDEGLDAIMRAYADSQGIGALNLTGEPQSAVPPWLEGTNPNAQLNEIRQQIWQLATYLQQG